MQFRYKTATPEERRAHLLALHARQDTRRIEHLAHSALRFVQDNDYRRGVRIVSDWANSRADLLRLVNAELAVGTPSINIPRRAATAYIRESNE